ncbi:MAG: hypothetical protein RI885_958 [Actinomycetota bacterium]
MTRFSDAQTVRDMQPQGAYDAAGQLRPDGADPGAISWDWTGGVGAETHDQAVTTQVEQHDRSEAQITAGRGHIDTFLTSATSAQQYVGQGVDNYEFYRDRSEALYAANAGRPLSLPARNEYVRLQNHYTAGQTQSLNVVKGGMWQYDGAVNTLDGGLNGSTVVAQRPQAPTPYYPDTEFSINETAPLKFPINIDTDEPGGASTVNSNGDQVGPWGATSQEPVTVKNGVPYSYTIFDDTDGAGPVEWTLPNLTPKQFANIYNEWTALRHGVKERDIGYISSYNAIEFREFRQAYNEIDTANRELAIAENPVIQEWLRDSATKQSDASRQAGAESFELSQARAIDEHERNQLHSLELLRERQQRSTHRLDDTRDFQIDEGLQAESRDEAAEAFDVLVSSDGTGGVEYTEAIDRRREELSDDHSPTETYQILEKEFGFDTRPPDSAAPSSTKTPQEVWGEQFPEVPGPTPELDALIAEQKKTVEATTADVEAARADLENTPGVENGEVPDRTRVQGVEKPILNTISAEEARGLIDTNQRVLDEPIATDAKIRISPWDVPFVVGASQYSMNVHAEGVIDAQSANLEVLQRQDEKDAELITRNSNASNADTVQTNRTNELADDNNVRNTNRGIEQVQNQGLTGDSQTRDLGADSRRFDWTVTGIEEDRADAIEQYNRDFQRQNTQSADREEEAENIVLRLAQDDAQDVAPGVAAIIDSVRHDRHEWSSYVQLQEIDAQVEQALKQGTISKEQRDAYFDDARATKVDDLSEPDRPQR